MSRKQIAKPVYVNFQFDENQVIEIYSLIEYLFTLLANRRLIGLIYEESALLDTVTPFEQAFNDRIYSDGKVIMKILSKDLTQMKRLLKNIQMKSKFYTGESNNKIKTLDEILTK